MKIKLLYILFFTTTALVAQEQWKLRKEGNGIKVYIKNSESSSLNSFKAVTKVKAPIENLLIIYITSKINCLGPLEIGIMFQWFK